MKNLKLILLVTLVSILISTIAGYWIFEMNWPFLPFPLLAGMAIIFVQKEERSYQFISKLLLGSLLYGFFTWLFIFTRMYLFVDNFPFWPLYNPQEYLIFSLVFSFLSFVGGLIGIVVKGVYEISIKYGKMNKRV